MTPIRNFNLNVPKPDAVAWDNLPGKRVTVDITFRATDQFRRYMEFAALEYFIISLQLIRWGAYPKQLTAGPE